MEEWWVEWKGGGLDEKVVGWMEGWWVGWRVVGWMERWSAGWCFTEGRKFIFEKLSKKFLSNCFISKNENREKEGGRMMKESEIEKISFNSQL